jgi:hypothetical protein
MARKENYEFSMMKDESDSTKPLQRQQWTGWNEAKQRRPAARDRRLDKARICATRPMLKSILLALIAVSSVSPFAASQRSPTLQEKLARVVGTYALSENNFPTALAKVAQDFAVPLGIEWVKLPSDPKEVKLAWRKATVREILQSIVRTRPGYELKVDDGIVHVLYPNAESDKKNFLNIPVQNFRSEDQYVAFSKQRLHDIVRKTIFPPVPHAGGSLPSVREIVVSGGEHKTTFTAQNGTIRDVLDKMALATDGKIWIVTFDEKAGLTSTGFRRTIASLWNTSATLSDQYQPGWDIIFNRGTVRGIGLPPQPKASPRVQ